MLCGRCLMCRVLVLSLPFFLSLSYFLQQSKKKRGRQRKVGFLLSGIITKEVLWFPAFLLTVEVTIMYFFIPPFPQYFWRGRWGTKQPRSLAIKAERRQDSLQTVICLLPKLLLFLLSSPPVTWRGSQKASERQTIAFVHPAVPVTNPQLRH